MATQGASAKKHATKTKAEKPKAEKPKAEKPKAEKPKAETKEKTTPPGDQTPKAKKTTVWDILLMGKRNKHGKFITDKNEGVQKFVPASEDYLNNLCEQRELFPYLETTEELVKALDSLGL